ncbi:MAG: beta/gamma crystallin-related protein [Telluria sp.]
MTRIFQFTLAAVALTLVAQAAQAQISLYDREGLHGRVFSTERPVRDFSRVGFNDRATSLIVESGRWEVCDDANFRGQCMVLRRGTYNSLDQMGMNDRISSVRPVGGRTQYDNEIDAPPQNHAYEFRRRANEGIYQARVTSAHAVVGAPEQRCWIAREQVSQPARDRNVGGALMGAVLGGVLGHQVGGGTGRTIATAGGAVAGAAIGSNMGNGSSSSSQDVRRCDKVASTTPAYWDVTYNYRGTEHRIQMASAPGPTVSVNGNGEPRQ